MEQRRTWKTAVRYPSAPAPGGEGAGAGGDATGAAACNGTPPRGPQGAGASGAASPPGQAPAPDGPPLPRQVRRHSVRDQVLQALRAALADGELSPGEVYSGPALGRRFGVSATPVREAMHRLAAEGSVEIVPNRGFRIAERGTAELAELAEVRALIEVPVLLRLACAEPAPGWAELRPRAEQCAVVAARGDLHAYSEHDRGFHRALLSLGGNRQLVQVAEDLHRRSQRPSEGSPAARRAELVADAAQHALLLDALAARDLPAVAALAREHVTRANG